MNDEPSPAPMPRWIHDQHPIPWRLKGGGLTLTGENSSFGEDGELYTMMLGSRGSTMVAPMTAADLRQLGEQIAAILAAPFRVVIPNPAAHDGPWLEGELRRKLVELRRDHPTLEIALLDIDALDSVPVEWSSEVATEGAPMRVLFYQTVADLYAAGGNLVLLVAGPGSLELSRLARDARLSVQLIRRVQA